MWNEACDKEEGRKDYMKAKAAAEDEALQLGKRKLDDQSEGAANADDVEAAPGLVYYQYAPRSVLSPRLRSC